MFKNFKKLAAFALLGVAGVACNKVATVKQLPYPETKRGDVTDNYFGTAVADPYRWLEDDNSAETAAWVKAQNAVTQDYLSQIPFRDAIRDRLTQLFNYTKESAPKKHGDWWYYNYNDGLKNQSVIYRTKDLSEQGEVFLDPNTLAEDGTVALILSSFSDDGRYFSYSAAASGSDWVEIRVIDTETKELLKDRINWVKFSGAEWAPDSKSFYYSAYDAPEKNVFSSKNEYQKVYRHILGEDQSEDELIYVDKKHPLRYFFPAVDAGGKWLFVGGTEGTSGTEILYKKIGERDFKVLLKGFDYDYEIIECKGDDLYFRTNEGALNYALKKINLRTLKQEVVIPEDEKNLLSEIGTAGGYLFANYLEDAQSRVYQYDWDGKLIRKIEVPEIGTIGSFGGGDKDEELYFVLTNYTAPMMSYHYDLKSGKVELYKRPEVAFDPEMFVTEQVFYTSKDGTKVPMFVSHRKDIELDGQNPCYLYAYGGFQINLTPSFNPAAIMFMEQGGIHCVANLRGGSEYGEAWHKGGMMANKQNVFDDFIAAAEYLIREKYTSSSKLAIAGGSNGGLLVGACEVQRPDLYAVCLPAVGVLDMLRFHKFTIGWGWSTEYGNSDNEEQFNYIYKYSPLHNIRQGVKYPATLVTTGDHDDRVVPAHSFKYTAEMQHAQGGDAPILIRIESKAGHGAGKPTSKRIDEAADCYAFVFQNVGVAYEPIAR